MIPAGPDAKFFSDALLEQAWPSFLGGAVTRRALLLVLTAVVVWIDYLTGPTIRFPVFFVLPCLLFSWYDGFLAGMLTGSSIVAARFVLETRVWPSVPWPLSHTLVNAASTFSIVVVLAWFCSRAGRLTREVRLLWGLLPICMHCRRIRTEKRGWENIENYVTERSQAKFTHGICPDCIKKEYPEIT
jgi:hypothetical protein